MSFLGSRERHSLHRRIIALAAAYVIALSGLVASFAVANAAVDELLHPAGVICHTDYSGQQAPSPADHAKLCVDCCGTGCTMLMAALPPPPTTVVALVRSAQTISHRLVHAALPRAPETRSHRSRAPPSVA